VLGVISNVFYQDIGFSKPQIATAVKTFGVIVSILGGLLGGLMATRYGVMRILMLGAILSAATNLIFVVLALAGPDLTWLYIAVAADNLAAGLASAAFVAFLSSLTSVSFTAVQYAIFSSLMTLAAQGPGRLLRLDRRRHRLSRFLRLHDLDRRPGGRPGLAGRTQLGDRRSGTSGGRRSGGVRPKGPHTTAAARTTRPARPGCIRLMPSGSRRRVRIDPALDPGIVVRDDRSLISGSYGTDVRQREPAPIMVFLHRILPLLIAAAFIVGCAQSPTRPAPERQTGDASERSDSTRTSGPETDPAEGEALAEPVAEPPHKSRSVP
jgi:hypothetical protein